MPAGCFDRFGLFGLSGLSGLSGLFGLFGLPALFALFANFDRILRHTLAAECARVAHHLKADIKGFPTSQKYCA